MNLSGDWSGICGQDASLAIWTGTTFGRCFAIVAFTFPSHAIAILVTAYLLGRYPKSLNNHVVDRDILESTRLPFPSKWSYMCQLVLLSIILLPLVILMLIVFLYPGRLDCFVDDMFIFLVFSVWTANLAYLRRIHISKYVFMPGLVPITISAAIVFVAQFPMFMSYDSDFSSAFVSIDFIFIVIYQVLLLLVVIGFVGLIFIVKRKVFEVYAFVADDSTTLNRPLIQDSGSSYGSVVSSQSYVGATKRVTNFVGRLLFWDAFYLLRRGRKFGLESVESLILLPTNLRANFLLGKFSSTFNKVLASGFTNEECLHDTKYLDGSCSHVSLLKILLNCFGVKFFAVGILRLLSDSLSFSTPYLLGLLVTFISDSKETIGYGAIIATLLFVATLLASLFNAWFTYHIQTLSMQVRSSLIAAIFSKCLVTPYATLNSQFNTGQILTFLTTDCDRAANMAQSFHSLWSLPFQIAIAFYLLYSQLGLYFLAGVVLAVLMIPINFFICRKIMKLTQEMLSAKDDRVKLTTELISGIKPIKLYAWEAIFKSKIESIRLVELWRCLKGRKILDAFCVFFWAATPLMMQFSTFIAFIYLSGEPLTSTRVYTSIALFNMLIAPLNALPWCANGLIDGIISVRRLEKLFRLLQFRAILRPGQTLSVVPRSPYFCAQSHSAQGAAVEVSPTALFSFPGKKAEEADVDPPAYSLLMGHSLTAKPGSLVCVIGGLGSGKSAFLLSLAGELIRDQGSVYVEGASDFGIGFASQQPWLVSGSIRSNILMDRPFNSERYEKIIYATALTTDLQQMTLGDRTEVGEEGSALSGGQRQRVALARAIYDDRQRVYLLDDPLAAVDMKVARHIFSECIIKLLVDNGKTVIMATNRYDLASRSDLTVKLSDGGRVEAIGKPQDVLGMRYTPDEDFDDSEILSIEETATRPTRAASSSNSAKADDTDEQKETSKVGSVKFAVWNYYAKASGYGWVAFALITLVLMQGSRNACDIWLAHWLGTADSQNSTIANATSSNETQFYIAVYGGIGAANLIFTLARAFSFAYVGLFAAGFLHERLLASVLRAPLSFYENTPIGRILNRFTADVWACDDSVPFELNILLAQVAGLVGTLATIIYSSYITLIAVLPMAVIYYFLQRFYRYSSRDLKRLQMTSQAPIFSHATSYLLSGSSLPVIRCLAIQNEVLEANKKFLDSNQRVQFSSLLASQWLSTTLQLMGVVAVGACCGAAIFEHWQQTANPALVGLSLSYALSLTGFLSGLIGSFTETERQMISVERVKSYIDDLPQEKADEAGNRDETRISEFTAAENRHIPAVQFDNVWVQYRSAGPFALRGISLSIKAGERVAVVGRTGAGKSSIFASLFRLVSPSTGTITVNGFDAASLSRQKLRAMLASVPQEPVVFSGSVRFNLDPAGLYDDATLLNALNLAQLNHVVERISTASGYTNLLDCDVGERGSKFSLGERQLLCVARALASSTASVLCADEPTASVDAEIEAQVISALCQGVRPSNSFNFASQPRRSLLMIAHRLSNVLADGAFDRVIVVDNGRVIENGSPRELLANSDSFLSRLINATALPAEADSDD